MLRCESLLGLDQATCSRVLNKNYKLLVSMAPLSNEIRPISSCTPQVPHLVGEGGGGRGADDVGFCSEHVRDLCLYSTCSSCFFACVCVCPLTACTHTCASAPTVCTHSACGCPRQQVYTKRGGGGRERGCSWLLSSSLAELRGADGKKLNLAVPLTLLLILTLLRLGQVELSKLFSASRHQQLEETTATACLMGQSSGRVL